MNIQLPKSVLIQPRTVLRNSDVRCFSTFENGPPRGAARTSLLLQLARTHHSFRGSFSAVSTPILTIKYSFCRIFQNLENKLTEFSKFLKIFVKFRRILQNLIDFSGFCKICKIWGKKLQNFAIFCNFIKIQRQHFVDFEKSCKMSI